MFYVYNGVVKSTFYVGPKDKNMYTVYNGFIKKHLYVLGKQNHLLTLLCKPPEL